MVFVEMEKHELSVMLESIEENYHRYLESIIQASGKIDDDVSCRTPYWCRVDEMEAHI